MAAAHAVPGHPGFGGPSGSFLLVPGAGGAGWIWHRVVDALHARGHAAVAVDLPADDERAGLAEYAQVCEDAARTALPADRPLVVAALSMGGFTAPLLVGRLPVRALVLVNAMVPLPGETGGAWWRTTGQAQARLEQAELDGRDVSGEFDERAEFFHDVPDELTEQAFTMDARPQSDRPFADPWPLSTWPAVTTVVLAGDRDRLFPASFQVRVARERLGLDAEIVPGGHLAPLGHPTGITDRLERLLQTGR
ncbi:alpha/beta fold hydrolase [Nakamurella leprariae]|uniref:alpha/beta fold hydrolase n=1 Tax=Nakamurella leprariae TaxID=2803911 RepID=UPI001F28B510|nr:alpha/beta fold hydrolase [Nakamurella leprariae]